ncbi:hypothetical protein Anapl_07685 [Anas platyrhynchos]|uniref:Uncharacterized protein n=1 Tax=Anas platyrhynchos TaxID=8839 RepID=R0M4Z3_ANAPL|nr:hypothetical protein Anapl_07685 [Anas platyrhynchos]
MLQPFSGHKPCLRNLSKMPTHCVEANQNSLCAFEIVENVEENPREDFFIKAVFSLFLLCICPDSAPFYSSREAQRTEAAILLSYRSSQPSVIPDKDQVLVVAVVVVVVWSLTGSHQPQEITRLFRGGSNNEDILTGATSKGSGPASSSTTDTCSHPSSLCYHKSLCSKMMNRSNNAGS